MTGWLADVAAVAVGIWCAALIPALAIVAAMKRRKPKPNEALIAFLKRRGAA